MTKLGDILRPTGRYATVPCQSCFKYHYPYTIWWERTLHWMGLI